jgi:hypothetical protein
MKPPNKIYNFCVDDGESFTSENAMRIAIKEKIHGLGGYNFNDGFVVNDEFI